jgi:hypothetical protein
MPAWLSFAARAIPFTQRLVADAFTKVSISASALVVSGGDFHL